MLSDEERKQKNLLLDVLFKQLDELPEEQRNIALSALDNWRIAKQMSFLGLGPMTARHEYKAAYKMLSLLEVEMGGMLPPYEE